MPSERSLLFLASLLLALTRIATPSVAVAQNTANLINSGNWSDPAIWSTVPAGTYPNNDNPTLGDTWNVTVSGNSVNVNQNITINNLNWSQGTIGGANTLNLLGSSSSWSSGVTKEINSLAAAFINSGTINLSGTAVRSLAIGSGLTNATGGVFNITSDGSALVNFNIGTFHNNSGATFEKTAGAGTSSVAWTFNNSGAVAVQSGTLSFTGGGSYGGTTAVSTGATAEFNNGTFALQNLGSTSGLGTMLLSNATINLANGATYTSGAYLNQTGGTLAGAGDASSKLILNGNYDWSAGSLGGNGLININGTNNVWSSGVTKEINALAANAINNGTINLSGTAVRSLAIGSGLTNATGGVFNITSDGSALVNFNIGTFNNNSGATFEKTAGGATSDIFWNFANSGLVQATSGVLNFAGAFSQSATGALKVNGATIALPGTPSLEGDLLGTGKIQAATLNHQNGAISPGLSPGVLDFTGNLNLSATTTLNYELGTSSDLITVGGNLTLDGVLNVTAASGFGAGLYTLFQYLGTLTDNGLNFGTLPSGRTYQLINDTAHHQVQLSVVPEPGTLVLLLFAAVGWWAIQRRR